MKSVTHCSCVFISCSVPLCQLAADYIVYLCANQPLAIWQLTDFDAELLSIMRAMEQEIYMLHHDIET